MYFGNSVPDPPPLDRLDPLLEAVTEIKGLVVRPDLDRWERRLQVAEVAW